MGDAKAPSLARVAVDVEEIEILRRLDDRRPAAGVEIVVELEVAIAAVADIPVVAQLQVEKPVDVLEDRQPVFIPLLVGVEIHVTPARELPRIGLRRAQPSV